jgi:hypothetical protein
MTRLPLAPVWAAVCSVALIACLPSSPKPDAPADLAGVGPVETGDMAEATTDASQTISARTFFNTMVLPSVVPTCGGCHKVEGGVGPGFLKSANPDSYDPYPTMHGWPDFIRIDDPAQSKFIRKGVHEGPALVGADTNCNDQCGLVLQWLELEKEEGLILVAPTFKAAVKPFYPTIGGTTIIDLSQVSEQMKGASLRFKTTALPGGRGIEISDLRLFNTKAGAVAGDQRTIRMTRPLFVAWNNGVPLPDPGDSFANTDRTIRLFQDDNDPNGTNAADGPGNLIIPGLFTMTQFRSGSALSVVFDTLNVLPPLPGTNPCKPAGLTAFNGQVAPYIRATQACTRAGCHDPATQSGGLNMFDGTKLPLDDTKNKELCESLKFYLEANTIKKKTDQAEMGHPFKWNSTSCTAAGFPATCFTTFTGALDAWKAAEN